MNNLIWRTLLIVFFASNFSSPQVLQAETVYRSVHDEIVTEVGSAEWNKFSPEEQERYLKETKDDFYPPGKPETYNDYLVLGPLKGKMQQFCVLHLGRVQHQSTLSGTAVKKGNTLEYHDAEAAKCRLKIIFEKEWVKLEDVDGECKNNFYCGVRADFEEAAFPNTPVKDPEVLKNALERCPLKTPG